MKLRGMLWLVCALGCAKETTQAERAAPPKPSPSEPAKDAAVATAPVDPTLAPTPDALEGTPAERGARLYQNKGCNACHTIDGSPRVGPSWKGLWGSTVRLSDGRTVPFDAAWVRKSVLEPTADIVAGFPPAMPSFAGKLSDQDIADLVAYFESLR